MVKIVKIESMNQLKNLKADYFKNSSAPLDGMWHFGFVAMAEHFGFYYDDVLVGYFCVNAEGYLLQFYLAPNSHTSTQDLFSLIAQQHSNAISGVKGAFVSTAEPEYMSLCLENSSVFKVNSLMYQHAGDTSSQQNDSLALMLASEQQLTEFVEFAVDGIGAPAAWLTGYYGNLIKRKELFGYWQEGQLLASGECRLFDDFQINYADLGVIVAQPLRGQGIATAVLKNLAALALSKGLTSICSTESGNLAAQKAISNANFSSNNRIVQFEFT